MNSDLARLSSAQVSSPQEYPCPNCHAAKRLRGSRAFASVTCAACGAEWRPRGEVGGYRLHELLGRGGFSLIFRASDLAGGESVAVKIFALPPGCTAEDAARFTNVVRTLAAYEHPHWLRVFGGGWEEDFAWLAMEWLPEGSLAARIPLSENEALHAAAQIADALVAAQVCGLQHRNLQIGECLLADARTLKVSGFAEAALYARAALDLGTVWGRLSCAPPERVFEEPEDARSEIYALGAILFQLLTGELPYEGETLPEYFVERLDGPPPKVREYVPSIREATAGLLDRMLAIDPQERFSSWAETSEFLGQQTGAHRGNVTPVPQRAVSKAVARAVEKQPLNAPARGAWFAIMMLAGVAGIAGWFGWKHFQRPPDALDAPTKKPTVPAIPAPANLDWGPWKKFILESPSRAGIGRGGDERMPGSGALRLRGNNSGMSGAHDENVFFAREMPGDWSLIARVSANTGPAGIVAREDTGSDRPCVGIFMSADGKLNSLLRPLRAAKLVPAPVAGGTGSKWLRLVRRGSTISAYYSSDRKDWHEAATLNLPTLPPAVPVGFVVWSGSKEKEAGATFEEVALDALR